MTELVEYDWEGIQERLAFLLHQLATKVIGETIKVDPLAADNAIRYCRERIAGGAYHAARQQRFWDFVVRCGGSPEWIIDGDVTSLVVSYAKDRPDLGPYRGEAYQVLDEDECA